ncbi:isoamyl acetate-hydrolyzing esterase 1 homolog isoform X2 [Ambystoma mexicanum]
MISKNSSVENIVAFTIFFGANDCAIKEENPIQHVPLDEYVKNLKSMISYLKTVDVPENRVILITPPPLQESAWGKWCNGKGYKLNRTNSLAGDYAKACVQVASSCGTEVLDLWTLMQKDNQDYSCYLSDGLHLSVTGNEFVAANLWPLLEKKVSSLPIVLPYWADIDPLHPEATLLDTSYEFKTKI